MKKSVKCTVLCLIMVCCMVFSLPLTASASDFDLSEDRIFYMVISEPPANSHQGYLNLLYYNSSTSEYRVFTHFWSCMSVAGDGEYSYSDDCSVAIDISKSNGSVKLYCYTSISDFKQMSVGYGRIQDGARSAFYSSFILKDSLDTIVTFNNPSGFSLIGYQVFGNGFVINSDFPSSGSSASKPFVVNWGSDALLSSRVTEILAELYILAANDETMISQLDELLSKSQTSIELLSDIKTFINNNNIQNNEIISLLEEIRDLLKGSGESTFEEPSTESISDYNKAEDELVSGADDTSDIEQQIEDFEIDANSSGLIWGIIQAFLNQHELVFGLVVGVLCLGIIALILNR